MLLVTVVWTQQLLQVTAFQPQLQSSSSHVSKGTFLSSSLAAPPLQYANSAMEDEQAASTPASFQQRMQKLIRPDKTTATSTWSSSGPTTSTSTVTKTTTNPLVQEISTLQEYKDAVMGQDTLVVVKFYAPWCRACRAMAPGFNALTKRNSNHDHQGTSIKFVQVAMSDKTMNLFKGLSVPSIPFAHIYHPTGGLVEEQRLTRTELRRFQHVLADYQQESCSLLVQPRQTKNEQDLEVDQVWSAENPYLPSPPHDDDQDDDGN
jgi:thiol-disulfide isomerase/thioredoxin